MKDTQALHEMVRAAMERHAVPGAALGIYDGGVEHTEGFGVTSVENPLPVDPDTIFQIGSITKTVTATAIMVLVERGMLDLEEPVRNYLPGLLQHRPGFTPGIASSWLTVPRGARGPSSCAVQKDAYAG
jgi:CubicO group peptidase (beta-lactamase class C family)